jgi:hypothetical protein
MLRFDQEKMYENILHFLYLEFSFHKIIHLVWISIVHVEIHVQLPAFYCWQVQSSAYSNSSHNPPPPPFQFRNGKSNMSLLKTVLSSGMVSNSCYTSGTSRVTLVTKYSDIK